MGMKIIFKVLRNLTGYLVTAILFFWMGYGLKQHHMLDYDPYAPSDDPSFFKDDKDNLIAMLRNHAGVLVEEKPDLHDLIELAKCLWAMSYAMPDRSMEMLIMERQVLEIGLKSAESKSDRIWMQDNLKINQSHIQKLKLIMGPQIDKMDPPRK